MTRHDLIQKAAREFAISHPHTDLHPDSIGELSRVAVETVARVGAVRGSRMNSLRLKHAATRAARNDARCGPMLSTIAIWALSQLVQYLLHLWLRDGVEARCMMQVATGLPAWTAGDDGAETQLECAAMVAARGTEMDSLGAYGHATFSAVHV